MVYTLCFFPLQNAVCFVILKYLFPVKGKSVPLQARSGPDGTRKLRFPNSVTKAQDDGKVVSLMHRLPLPRGNAPGTHFC